MNRNHYRKDEDADVVGDEDEFTVLGAATPEVIEDDVKKIFQQDVEEAWELEQKKPKNSSARDAYIKNHYQNWEKIMPDRRNFLHFLADQSNTKLCQQWVVARAVTKLPELMGALDREKHTPLTVAIHRRNKIFIHAVCKNISEKNLSIIREALKKECHPVDTENRVTCLHAAISGSIDKDYILDIINLAPDEMFTVVDLKGRTPLHLAVEYLKSSSHQVHIVKGLLYKGLGALKIRSSDVRENKFSAYQYHVKTRKDHKDLDIREDEKKQMRPPGASIRDGLAKKIEMTKPDRTFKDANRDEQVSDHRAALHTCPPTPSAHTRTLTNLKHSNEPTYSETSPMNNRPILKSDKTNEGNERLEAERQRFSDEILALLKLEYLRNLKPLEALDYLHIQGSKDKELWFDFGPPRHGTIKRSEFIRQFDHLEFDEVLQYVAFPRLELEDPGEENDNFHDHHNGRQDMKFFFDWFKKKGVKRILRVEVDDMEIPYHSDEGIEQALEGLHVEVLDWRRLDLDPGTIQKIGSDLRELQLYWSGGNNVLRSWSEENEGLCVIKSLKRITLTQLEFPESKARTQHNLKVFRGRLEESWKRGPTDGTASADSQKGGTVDLIVNPDFRHGSHGSTGLAAEPFPTTHSPQPHVDPHKWMECMEKFANSFCQIPELRKKRPDMAFSPVKIALIDDGVDITHPDLRGLHNQNLPGKSFDYSEDGWCRVSPYWISVSGHGTLMARLIRRICPSANIYVIKVRTIPTVNAGKVQIETESTIKAIKHALEIGAQIISMSWTTKPPELSSEKSEFDKVISEAGSKPTLMFCSASDQGLFEDFTYPHASNPALTFRVGAAKATGNTADFVGDGLNFVFPGQDVVLGSAYADPTYDRSFDAFASHTGSSVATALAAGLAAVVYECVRLGVIHTNNPQAKTHGAIPRTELTAICKKARMKKCFESMGVNRQSGKPYLEVWNRFEQPGIDIENNQESEEQLRIVSGLARLLLEII